MCSSPVNNITFSSTTPISATLYSTTMLTTKHIKPLTDIACVPNSDTDTLEHTILRTLNFRMHKDKAHRTFRMLIDEGSTLSLVSGDLFDILTKDNLGVIKHSMDLNVFTINSKSIHKSNVIAFQIISDTNVNSSLLNNNGRNKRQLGLRLGAATVIGSLILGSFTVAELSMLSSKISRLEEINNHIVETVDAIEHRVMVSEVMSKTLNTTVFELAADLTLSNNEIKLNAIAANMVSYQDLLLKDLYNILEGLTDALGGRFNHRLSAYDQLQVALSSIKARA